jgi:hypothetical protein
MKIIAFATMIMFPSGAVDRAPGQNDWWYTLSQCTEHAAILRDSLNNQHPGEGEFQVYCIPMVSEK